MKNISQWLVLGIIAAFIGMRLTVYGDLRLTVANRDTQSYIDSSKVDPLSGQAFKMDRPYTMNLVYGVFTPGDGYRIRAISDGDTGTVFRKPDRGFKEIAILQSALSMIGWSLLAWVFSLQLKNGAVKITSAFIIMLFGFTPQMVDWDSVLAAESLSVSLFVISYALVIWLAFEYQNQPADNIKNILIFLILFAALFFWAFTRDINANLLIFLAIFIMGLYISPRFRKAKLPLVFSLLILSLVALGFVTSRQRLSWVNELIHVWESDILPAEGNVQYFTNKGMPEYDTPEFYEWFEKHAPSTYMQFLAAHPAYTTYKFFRDQHASFRENMQPYFKTDEWTYRPLLIIAGNYLHPISGSVFPITLMLLVILWNQFLFQKNQAALPWMWLMTLAFLIATGAMFLNVFGDAWALIRHTLSSTTTYRLLMWMLLLILLDFSTQREKASQVV